MSKILFPIVIATSLMTMLMGSCGRAKEFTLLSQKSMSYLNMTVVVQDKFTKTDVCNYLLFSGLLGSVGVSVDLTSARLPEGYWLDRPAIYPVCLTSGASRLTVSHDKILDVLV